MPTMYDFIRFYTVEELQSMVPIEEGHMSNLMLERKSDCRLWYSRMTVEDGATANHEVTVEVYNHETGKWFNWQVYYANDVKKGYASVC